MIDTAILDNDYNADSFGSNATEVQEFDYVNYYANKIRRGVSENASKGLLLTWTVKLYCAAAKDDTLLEFIRLARGFDL